MTNELSQLLRTTLTSVSERPEDLAALTESISTGVHEKAAVLIRLRALPFQGAVGSYPWEHCVELFAFSLGCCFKQLVKAAVPYNGRPPQALVLTKVVE